MAVHVSDSTVSTPGLVIRGRCKQRRSGGFVAVLRLAILGVALQFYGPSDASAQTAAERHAQLTEVADMISGEPDPLMRIANLETIVAKGDRLMTEMAIRNAMAIDDKPLRSVALAAYLRSARDMTFHWPVPSDVQKSLSRKKPPRSAQYIARANSQVGGRVVVRLAEFDDDGSFKIEKHGAVYEASTGRIVGDRIEFRARMVFGAFCNFAMHPSKSLVLDGTMTCESPNLPGQFELTAEMF